MMTRVACGGRNFSYSFITNFLKICRCFFHVLKMCICFWGYPPIIFYQFFLLFQHCFSGPISIRMIPCGRNSSYSFPPIIFKLCLLILYCLKVWFCGYLTSIFYQFFPLLGLSFFQVQLVESIPCRRNSF